MTVRHQPASDSRQIRPGFADGADGFGRHDADESVLCQVGGSEGISQPTAQPSEQPPMVVAIERVKLLKSGLAGRHEIIRKVGAGVPLLPQIRIIRILSMSACH